MENVHIHNVYGTYYQYCIGVTKYYKGDDGYFDGLSFDNIFASKAERLSVYQKDGTYVFALIWVEGNLRVKNLSIADLHRVERITAIPTVYVGENTVVEDMSLTNISCENLTGTPMPLIENDGTILRLHAANLRSDGEEIFGGSGEYPKD